jgi:hypothetical protein
MSDTDIRAQVDEFVALPKAERRAKYMKLPKPVRLRARAIIEKNRGIAYRADGGRMVLTKEGYIQQLLKRQAKIDAMPRRMEALKARMVETKKQLQENWGDEALSEAENALEEASTPAPANQE